jgi:hypothetical protein
MITSSGPICDVCGKYILPLGDELVNFFSVKQLPGEELCCHNACKQTVLNTNSDWQKLPQGPLRKAYEEASLKMLEGEGEQNHV